MHRLFFAAVAAVASLAASAAIGSNAAFASIADAPPADRDPFGVNSTGPVTAATDSSFRDASNVLASFGPRVHAPAVSDQSAALKPA